LEDHRNELGAMEAHVALSEHVGFSVKAIGEGRLAVGKRADDGFNYFGHRSGQRGVGRDAGGKRFWLVDQVPEA
jgi:hypothetical protein